MKTLLVLVIMLAVALPIEAETTIEAPADTVDAYEFPMPFGSAEWKALRGYRARLDACQIPEDVLAEMSTEGLVQTCLDYPLRHDWMFSSVNILVGMKGVISGFNGLSELVERPDAAVALLKAYKGMDTEVIEPPWTQAQRTHQMDLSFIEMLLGDEDVLLGMTHGTRYDLLAACLDKHAARNPYSYTACGTVNILMGRILRAMDYEPFMQEYAESDALRGLLDSALLLRPREELAETVYRHAERCLLEGAHREGKR